MALRNKLRVTQLKPRALIPISLYQFEFCALHSPNAMAINTEPQLPADVVKKLLIVTVAILVLPVVTFFLLRNLGFGALISGGAAAGVAQLLLIGYIIVAVFEKDPFAKQIDEKKQQ